jgi:hypothetical protein
MLRLQYASDLHLEFLRGNPAALERLISGVERLAPTLILAGDIGNPFQPEYARFVGAMAERFERVLLVAGNHEFYGNAIAPTLLRIEEVCSDWPNVVFLNNSVWEAGPVRFFGGTMWSRISDSEKAEVRAIMNDFARIRDFGLDEYESEHVAFTEALSAELERSHSPLVVVSHYLPSFRLIHPKYLGSSINSAFATEMAVADDARISAWFYGHTHTGRDGPRFFCNPIGYPGENFRPSLNRVAEIPLP